MPSTAWNPATYLVYAEERTQPFVDLLRRVGMAEPGSVVDLGCGPGQGMPVLRSFWPDAHITGVESSAEMLTRAREATAADGAIEYRFADMRTVTPAQLPGNFDAPSHRLLAELAVQGRYAAHLDPQSLLNPTAAVNDYMHDVARPGWTVEAWETTYHHVLQGTDPVFTWIAGTAGRPVLQALPETEREQFAAEYKAALREAYPSTSLGTVLPFRRLFFIARRGQS